MSIMLQSKIIFDEKTDYKKSGYFKYTDHYSNEPDNIFFSTITTQSKTRLIVSTSDGIFKKAAFTLSNNELNMLANMIKLAWQNPTINFNCAINSNKKIIAVKTEKSGVKLEKNKHMTIKINDKCIAYGFDINDSRRLYKTIAQLLNKKGSTLLS